MCEQVNSIQVKNQLKPLADLIAHLKSSLTLRGPSVHFARKSFKQFYLRIYLQEMCIPNWRQCEHQGI